MNSLFYKMQVTFGQEQKVLVYGQEQKLLVYGQEQKLLASPEIFCSTFAVYYITA
jgi:hypothetical protein